MPNLREVHRQLQGIVQDVESHTRLSGEGREQELRAYLRNWLTGKLAWPATQVRGSEKYDLQLLDGAGLYAAYIETKDPDVGISKAEQLKTLARALAREA